MANLFELKDRRVVPNWRSFGKTTVLGELNSLQTNKIINSTSIDEYVIDWKLNHTIIHASDLLSAAIINGFLNNPIVEDAAKFILDNELKATYSQVSLANKILLNSFSIDDYSKSFENINSENLLKNIDTSSIYTKIKDIKEQLRKFPYNSIYHVELSRYYSILGQEEKAINSIRIAIHLSPNNRFVLRCATRLFAHYHNDKNQHLNYIHSILSKSRMTLVDPWLLSAEISIATILKKHSRFIKKGIELINSNNIMPFNYTELASSIGTVELLSGSRKKSKEFFNKALISPNDNSLAQIEWASSKDDFLNLTPSHYDVKMNYEALALDLYHNNKFEEAVENSVKWFIDMPFSKRPIMFGASLASSLLKDQNKAIDILNAGLISHPNDPQIINNLAFSLALGNRASEAFHFLDKIRNSNEIDDVNRICLLATRGLAFFRSNKPEIGRSFYMEAISQTKAINNPELNWIAILNYTREEILSDSEYVEHLMNEIHKIPVNDKMIEIKMLKEDVIDLYNKLKTVN